MTEIEFENGELSAKIVSDIIITSCGPMEYAEVGSGFPVVCIHGAMGGYDQSLILAQTVAMPDYRFIAISRPGYLGTPLSSGRSPEQQARLLAEMLTRMQIDRVGIMAISGGGPLALAFAAGYPERCAGLVQISTCAKKTNNPIPFSFKVMSRLIKFKWVEDRIRQKAGKDPKQSAKRSIHDESIYERTIADPIVWPLFSRLLESTTENMAKRMPGTLNDINITRTVDYELEKITAPVLVVHGTKDPLLEFEVQTQEYMTRLPHARLLAVEGGEHVAIFTHRQQVQGAVCDFMQEHCCS